jgi:hypothetical protein
MTSLGQLSEAGQPRVNEPVVSASAPSTRYINQTDVSALGACEASGGLGRSPSGKN